jgi:reverse gyrase
VNDRFRSSYVVSPEKYKVVKELKEWVKKVDEVWLATDEDREGEAISWHLCEVLGLDPRTTKRIVFREITKPAIEKAIQHPRSVDLNLVNAQQARRVLDRLVGYELSEILWKKVRGKLSNNCFASSSRSRDENSLAIFNCVTCRYLKGIKLKIKGKEKLSCYRMRTPQLGCCVTFCRCCHATQLLIAPGMHSAETGSCPMRSPSAYATAFDSMVTDLLRTISTAG